MVREGSHSQRGEGLQSGGRVRGRGSFSIPGEGHGVGRESHGVREGTVLESGRGFTVSGGEFLPSAFALPPSVEGRVRSRTPGAPSVFRPLLTEYS